MTDTKYNLLFTLELLHKYFKNQLCTDFTITPSNKTKEVLNGHQIIAKQYGNQLYAGVQLDEFAKPLPEPEEGMQLTFFLELNNPLFFNYTNLPFAYPTGQLYYFTNRNKNISNGKRFLSSNYTPYSLTKEYKPGDLATNAAGTLFQATRTSTGVTPPDDDRLSNSWMQIDPVTYKNHYVSEQDAVQWLPTVSPYHFTSDQSSADILVFGYESYSATYSQLLLTKTVNFSAPVSSFSLDLTALPPAKYKLVVNGSEKNIYINDELSRKKTFAVVDIFNESILPAEYKMINAGSLINPPPVFSVYFLNRSTIWRYAIRNGVAGVITDAAGVYQFPTVPSDNVYSAAPIPLKDMPLDIRLQVGGDPVTPVACASPQRLTNYSTAGDLYYCSEIFINY